MTQRGWRRVSSRTTTVCLVLVVGLIVMALVARRDSFTKSSHSSVSTKVKPRVREAAYKPRAMWDESGFKMVVSLVEKWPDDASLSDIARAFEEAVPRSLARIDDDLAHPTTSSSERISALIARAMILNYEADPQRAYEALVRARELIESSPAESREMRYSVIYFQGVCALRIGENDNCILCRGESSCILPISVAAQHKNTKGSSLAIQHFTEYLEQFPQDEGVRWLLNVAHMTLGQHPHRVDPRHLVKLDRFEKSEFDIGRFRDIGHQTGLNRLNQGGGGIMEDFDSDGLLDIAVTNLDPRMHMEIYRNMGNGTFEAFTESAGLKEQLGGLNCVQTDFNNDGHCDIFVIRAGWLPHGIRPSLLKNNGDRTFTDVTQESGLSAPVSSIAAGWSDYDNDGWLDVFICCEQQPSRLYRNRRDGTFEEVSEPAGVALPMKSNCKGVTWLDYDNDNYPDLFLNFVATGERSVLMHNNRDGTFHDVSDQMGINGPEGGFSCWSWDVNNDGWLDIFATCYYRTVGDVARGLRGEPHRLAHSRLFLNREGKRFEDVTQAAGLDMVLATMGSNFADFDNDGLLDMYLGTGEPSLSMLVPNRMFKNVQGSRFAEITASSGTGNLQKGHGVACGDWNRDGNVDLFVQMGGASNGDRYHNILFQNPGHPHHWLTLKLIGQKSNRASLGARIKIVTTGNEPLTIHRHITTGSSFGGNPLQQTIGLGNASRIATLEIHWPTSDSTQVFRDLAVDQALEVTEFDESVRVLDWQPVVVAQ
jgi:FG-GAP-like repeat/ASPIC and UnbV